MEISCLSRFVRKFSTVPLEPKPPSHLIKFIRGEINSPITSTLSASPQKLTEGVVRERVSQHFQKANFESYICDSPWSEKSYPKPSSFWPNPIIHNSRLKPFYITKSHGNTSSTNTHSQSQGENSKNSKRILGNSQDGSSNPFKNSLKNLHESSINAANESDNIKLSKSPDSKSHSEDINQVYLNKVRLENLWKYSSSHGVSWDKLDNYFFEFVAEKQKHIEDWKKYEEDILQFSSQKAEWIITKKRIRVFRDQGDDLTTLDKDVVDKLLKPRSLVKKLTRRLYFQYKSAYMNNWSEEKLIEFLKSKATDHMLKREEFERFYNGNVTENQTSGEDFEQVYKVDENHYPHFHKWDMEGVGKTRMTRFKEYEKIADNDKDKKDN